MSNKEGFEIDGGWVATAVMLALVFPVGLIMLWNKVKRFRRGKNESKQMARAGMSILAAGVGMLVLSFGVNAWAILDIFIGGGLLYGANTVSKREKRFRRYLALIGGRPFVPIAEIASAIPVSFEQAQKELQLMIEQ